MGQQKVVMSEVEKGMYSTEKMLLRIESLMGKTSSGVHLFRADTMWA